MQGQSGVGAYSHCGSSCSSLAQEFDDTSGIGSSFSKRHSKSDSGVEVHIYVYTSLKFVLWYLKLVMEMFFCRA